MKQVLIACMLTLMALSNAGLAAQSTPPPSFHSTTNWDVRPSFKYDTLCFLNILTGDPFYTRYYKDTYAHFKPMLTPKVKKALAAVKNSIKDEGGGIVSAQLSLYYSVVPARTLDQLIAATRNIQPLKKALEKTAYFDTETWKNFNSVRPQLITIFKFLQSIHFHQYWKEHVKPKTTDRAKVLKGWLDHFNIVPWEEGILGRPLTSNKITVYVLHFAIPHGIRITGTRFITDDAYPKKVVLMNAMHEMLHPPFDWEHDDELRHALETLKADPFLMQRVKHHNPSFGYNSFESFVEEDVVQASDELIAERTANQAYDPYTRWIHSDDGMHVLAVALYELAHLEHYDLTEESMRDFIVRMVKAGKLAPGKIKPLYERLYPPETRNERLFTRET